MDIERMVSIPIAVILAYVVSPRVFDSFLQLTNDNKPVAFLMILFVVSAVYVLTNAAHLFFQHSIRRRSLSDVHGYTIVGKISGSSVAFTFMLIIFIGYFISQLFYAAYFMNFGPIRSIGSALLPIFLVIITYLKPQRIFQIGALVFGLIIVGLIVNNVEYLRESIEASG
jgi:hypothetical protein